MIALLSATAWLITVTGGTQGPNWETSFLIAIFTAVAWHRPDRYGPTLLIAVQVFHWILVGEPSLTRLTAFSAALVAIHQASAVCDSVRSLRHLPTSLLLRWSWRTLAVVATTPIVLWLAAVRPIESTGAAALTGAALLALAATGWWLTPRPDHDKTRSMGL